MGLRSRRRRIVIPRGGESGVTMATEGKSLNHTDVQAPAQAPSGRSRMKEKALEEFRLYWVIACYLALMFGAFTWYKRFILAESGISYLHYGTAVVSALVLSKVILIGQAAGIARHLEGAPLIWSVLYKSAGYAVFAGLFSVLEHVVETLWHGGGWVGAWHAIFSVGNKPELAARSLVLLVTFIPFFALWETDRVLGEGRLWAFFFHRRGARELTGRA